MSRLFKSLPCWVIGQQCVLKLTFSFNWEGDVMSFIDGNTIRLIITVEPFSSTTIFGKPTWHTFNFLFTSTYFTLCLIFPAFHFSFLPFLNLYAYHARRNMKILGEQMRYQVYVMHDLHMVSHIGVWGESLSSAGTWLALGHLDRTPDPTSSRSNELH